MLTFIKELETRTADNHILWECLCACGIVCSYKATLVRTNKIVSCRKCSIKRTAEKNKTHGMRHTKEYRTWIAIKNRCLTVSSKDFKRYGGKGLEIEKDWIDSFESFYNHIGQCPSQKHSIDRIDNSKGYLKGNVRWATTQEQARNKSESVFVTDGSDVFHINEVAVKLGITRGAAHLRLKRGKLNGYTKYARMA
jgi:hypothetical protein